MSNDNSSLMQARASAYTPARWINAKFLPGLLRISLRSGLPEYSPK